MSIHEWDKRIAPKLENIEYCASKLDYYAQHLLEQIKELPVRPVWETLAQEALDKAQRSLYDALRAVNDAKEKYDHTPVMIESFQAAE